MLLYKSDFFLAATRLIKLDYQQQSIEGLQIFGFRWDYADGRVGGLIRDCVGGAPKESSLVERVVGHLNNEKAAPPSLLELSCGQGMHGRYLNQTSSNISCLKNLPNVFTLIAQ